MAASEECCRSYFENMAEGVFRTEDSLKTGPAVALIVVPNMAAAGAQEVKANGIEHRGADPERRCLVHRLPWPWVGPRSRSPGARAQVRGEVLRVSLSGG